MQPVNPFNKPDPQDVFKLYSDISDYYQNEAERLKQHIERIPETAAKACEKAANLVKARNALVEVGIDVPEISPHTVSWGLDVDVDRSQLTLVHKALGRLQLRSKHLEDPKKKMIQVYLSVANYKNVTIKYLAKLPKTKKGEPSKCKIVKRTVSELVCDL